MWLLPFAAAAWPADLLLTFSLHMLLGSALAAHIVRVADIDIVVGSDTGTILAGAREVAASSILTSVPVQGAA
jgi:hypothetical protein